MAVWLRYFLTGNILIFLAGWLRYFTTGSLKVDDNYPPFFASVLIVVFITLSVFLLAAGAFYLYRNPGNHIKTKHLALVFLIPVLAPPVMSNDVFSYLFYGEYFLQGKDPYLLQNGPNVFSPWVSDLYIDIPCVYGPVGLILSALAALPGNIWVSLLVIKMTGLAFSLLLYNSLKNNNLLVAVTLTPVLFAEVLGQGHNDVVPVYFLVQAVFGAQRLKVLAASGYALLVLMTKSLYLPLLVLPLFILYREGGFRRAGIFSLLVLTGIAIWYALWPHSMLAPVTAGFGLRPSGSWADAVHAVSHFMGWLDTGLFTFSLFFQLSAVALCILYTILFFTRQPFSGLFFPRWSAVIILIFYAVFIPRLFPWYLLFFIPLVQAGTVVPFRPMLLTMSVFVLQGLMHQFPEKNLIREIIIGSTSPVTVLLLSATVFYTLRYTLKKEDIPVTRV